MSPYRASLITAALGVLGAGIAESIDRGNLGPLYVAIACAIWLITR